MIIYPINNQESRSYSGYRVLRSAPRTRLGQQFLDREVEAHQDSCSVWKRPQK